VDGIEIESFEMIRTKRKRENVEVREWKTRREEEEGRRGLSQKKTGIFILTTV
jgi:hypothetical protein